MLSHVLYYRLAGQKRKRELRLEMRERYAYVPSISDIVYARLDGRGENRGIRVIDEAHNELNNREWAESNQKEMLKIMALSRKRGWSDYIIAQHANNTDAALRRICGEEIRLVDWQQITKLPVFQTKLIPFHLFLAQAFPTNIPKNTKGGSKPLWKELFFLSWQRKLYNTFQDYESEFFTPEEFDGVILPVPGGYDYYEHCAVQGLDVFFQWARMGKEKAAEDSAALSSSILEAVTSSYRPPPRPALRPLPRPQESRDESRTSTARHPETRYGSEA